MQTMLILFILASHGFDICIYTFCIGCLDISLDALSYLTIFKIILVALSVW